MRKTITMSEKNKAFWRKSSKQQAVAIAKDVIRQLSDKFFIANTGDYFNIENLLEAIEDVPLKLEDTFSMLKQTNAKCSVCGIGSCFVSLINLGNSVSTVSVMGAGYIDEYKTISETNMRPLLRKVFPPSQLSLIESAFEKTYMNDDDDTDEDTPTYTAVNFGRKYKTDERRLIAIMNNIIKNKGVFTP